MQFIFKNMSWTFLVGACENPPLINNDRQILLSNLSSYANTNYSTPVGFTYQWRCLSGWEKQLTIAEDCKWEDNTLTTILGGVTTTEMVYEISSDNDPCQAHSKSPLVNHTRSMIIIVIFIFDINLRTLTMSFCISHIVIEISFIVIFSKRDDF